MLLVFGDEHKEHLAILNTLSTHGNGHFLSVWT